MGASGRRRLALPSSSSSSLSLLSWWLLLNVAIIVLSLFICCIGMVLVLGVVVVSKSSELFGWRVWLLVCLVSFSKSPTGSGAAWMTVYGAATGAREGLVDLVRKQWLAAIAR